MSSYPLEWGNDPNPDDAPATPAASPTTQKRYPLEWGFHTDPPADEAAPANGEDVPAAKPEFTAIMPTLLGGAHPDTFPARVTLAGYEPGNEDADTQIAQAPRPATQPVQTFRPQSRSDMPPEELARPSEAANARLVDDFNAAAKAEEAKRQANEQRKQRAAAAARQLSTYASQPLPPNWPKKPIPADWQQQLPKEVLDSLNSSADRFKVPRELLARILWQESEFGQTPSNRRAQGQGLAGISTGAIDNLKNIARTNGDMARLNELEKLDRLKGPDSVNLAAQYLHLLHEENQQSWPAAIAAYKTGRTAANAWLTGNAPAITTRPEELGRLTAYLRYVFQGDPGRFDPRDAPDIP